MLSGNPFGHRYGFRSVIQHLPYYAILRNMRICQVLEGPGPVRRQMRLGTTQGDLVHLLEDQGALERSTRGIEYRTSQMDFMSGLEEIEKETQEAEAERLANEGEGWKAKVSELSGSIKQRLDGG